MKRVVGAKRGDRGALESYLADVAAIPDLPDDEVADLASRIRGEGRESLDARERLVRSHLKLAISIARRYAGYGLPLADLIAEGNLGLIRAAELYDPAFGARFRTYAAIWIKHRIHRAITNQAKVVRVPVWRSQRLRRISKLNDELSRQLGRSPSTRELGDRLGLPDEELASLDEARTDRVEVASLDSPVDTDDPGGATLESVLADDRAEHPADRMGRAELVEEMFACLHDLDDRELEVLTLKFGLHGEKAGSFRNMARRFGLSREWLRRIAELALVKIRRNLSQRLSPEERRRRRAAVAERIRRLGAAMTAGV